VFLSNPAALGVVLSSSNYTEAPKLFDTMVGVPGNGVQKPWLPGIGISTEFVG